MLAYEMAGVMMPSEMWGRPWQVWCGIEEHSRKVKIYQEMLETGQVPTLPALEVVRSQLLCGEEVYILTGAAHEAVTTFILRERLQGVHLLGWSATQWHKRSALVRLSEGKSRPSVTYVDDEYVPHIVPKTGLFVQYVGQTVEQLKEDIKWTPSSSPPART